MTTIVICIHRKEKINKQTKLDDEFVEDTRVPQ